MIEHNHIYRQWISPPPCPEGQVVVEQKEEEYYITYLSKDFISFLTYLCAKTENRSSNLHIWQAQQGLTAV